MRRSHRGGLISMTLLAGAVYTYWEYIDYIIVALLALFSIKLVVKIVRKIYILLQNHRLRGADSMDGTSFEYYVAQLLIDRGYTNVSLTEHYDYGVDIIAEKDGIRWGIQAKRYSDLVKADAVRQVVTGLKLYECDRAMVITNSTFSNVAKRLADGNDCVLVDRAGLYALAR